MRKEKRKANFNRRMLAFVLAFVLVAATLHCDVPSANAAETTTIYFVDATNEGWVADDSAIMELVDNTRGHDRYDMAKTGEKTWSVTVPASAYNITFNRYDATKSTL